MKKIRDFIFKIFSKRHLGEKIVIGGNVEPDLREVIGGGGYGSRKRVWAENLSSEWRQIEKMKKTKTHWQTLNKR